MRLRTLFATWITPVRGTHRPLGRNPLEGGEDVCRAGEHKCRFDPAVGDSFKRGMSEIDFDGGPRVQAERRRAFDRSDAQELLGRDDVAPKLLPARGAFELAELLERGGAEV